MSESNPQIATVELGFVIAVEKVWEAPFALYASSISSFVKSGAYSIASTLVLMSFMFAPKRAMSPKKINSQLCWDNFHRSDGLVPSSTPENAQCSHPPCHFIALRSHEVRALWDVNH
jgi:hypothetical protein